MQNKNDRLNENEPQSSPTLDPTVAAENHVEAIKDLAKHTPGPWCFERGIWNTRAENEITHSIGSVVTVKRSVFDNQPEWYIARVDNAGKDDGTQEANARLIAAAPELLVALKGLLADFERLELASISMWDAHRAIAKAEGRS